MARPDPLLRHIRHAEEWLGRARGDWRRGNAPAALLRLMLAEAEIRQARETGTAEEKRAAFERTAAELETRIGFLLRAIEHSTQEVIEHA